MNGSDVRTAGTAVLISGIIWSSTDDNISSTGAGIEVRSSSDAILISGVLKAKIVIWAYQIGIR